MRLCDEFGVMAWAAHHSICHADEYKDPDRVVGVDVKLQSWATHGRAEEALQQARQHLHLHIC